MASELHEAAERLRQWRQPVAPEGLYKDWREGTAIDCRILSDWALEMLDPIPIDEAWLRAEGWREWTEEQDEGQWFDLWYSIADEIGWKCRIGYTVNGFYAVRMVDTKYAAHEYDGAAESVELFGSRNTTKVVTRGQLRALLFALTPTSPDPADTASAG